MIFLQLIFSVLGKLNPKALMAMGAALAFVAMAWFFHHKGYVSCETDALKSTLEVKDKQNEIARNRPDFDALLGKLRSGNF